MIPGDTKKSVKADDFLKKAGIQSCECNKIAQLCWNNISHAFEVSFEIIEIIIVF